jgi:hypothetical protein
MGDALEAMLFCLIALIAVGIVTALAALTIVFYGWGPGAGAGRKRMGGVAAYLIVVGALGAWAYTVLPAQYTHDLNPSWPPSTRSLAAYHAEAEEQLFEGYLVPAEAASLRQMLVTERIGFGLGWLAFSLAIGPGVLGAIKLASRLAEGCAAVPVPVRGRVRVSSGWSGSAPIRSRRTAT